MSGARRRRRLGAAKTAELALCCGGLAVGGVLAAGQFREPLSATMVCLGERLSFQLSGAGGFGCRGGSAASAAARQQVANAQVARQFSDQESPLVVPQQNQATPAEAAIPGVGAALAARSAGRANIIPIAPEQDATKLRRHIPKHRAYKYGPRTPRGGPPAGGIAKLLRGPLALAATVVAAAAAVVDLDVVRVDGDARRVGDGYVSLVKDKLTDQYVSATWHSRCLGAWCFKSHTDRLSAPESGMYFNASNLPVLYQPKAGKNPDAMLRAIAATKQGGSWVDVGDVLIRKRSTESPNGLANKASKAQTRRLLGSAEIDGKCYAVWGTDDPSSWEQFSDDCKNGVPGRQAPVGAKPSAASADGPRAAAGPVMLPDLPMPSPIPWTDDELKKLERIERLLAEGGVPSLAESLNMVPRYGPNVSRSDALKLLLAEVGVTIEVHTLRRGFPEVFSITDAPGALGDGIRRYNRQTGGRVLVSFTELPDGGASAGMRHGDIILAPHDFWQVLRYSPEQLFLMMGHAFAERPLGPNEGVSPASAVLSSNNRDLSASVLYHILKWPEAGGAEPTAMAEALTRDFSHLADHLDWFADRLISWQQQSAGDTQVFASPDHRLQLKLTREDQMVGIGISEAGVPDPLLFLTYAAPPSDNPADQLRELSAAYRAAAGQAILKNLQATFPDVRPDQAWDRHGVPDTLAKLLVALRDGDLKYRGPIVGSDFQPTGTARWLLERPGQYFVHISPSQPFAAEADAAIRRAVEEGIERFAPGIGLHPLHPVNVRESGGTAIVVAIPPGVRTFDDLTEEEQGLLLAVLRRDRTRLADLARSPRTSAYLGGAAARFQLASEALALVEQQVALAQPGSAQRRDPRDFLYSGRGDSLAPAALSGRWRTSPLLDPLLGGPSGAQPRDDTPPAPPRTLH